MKSFLGILFALVLVGAGCAAPKFNQKVSGDELQSNAEELSIDAGSEIVIRGTLLGFGGKISEEFGTDKGRRVVTVKSYTPGGAVELDWKVKTRVETGESIEARETYLEENASIQEDAPDPPAPEYVDIDLAGSIATISLADAQTVYLPAYWPEGDIGAVKDNSLIWLSKKQYEELINERTSTLKLEVFENTLGVLELADKFRDAVDRLKREQERTSRIKDVYKLTAQPEWGTARIDVNGETKQVRTIQASNWFGNYVILANADNPLILKVTLNPFSFGALGLISPANVLDAFLGYEVVEITQ